MPNPRFELALEQLDPSQWRLFEKLASEFLSIEFPEIRTMASPNGDGGRDAECFVIESEPTMGFQYSVTSNWRPKIDSTVARLAETHPDITQMIYVTNQMIGAGADDLRAVLRQQGIVLDLRDRSWFIERESTHPQRQFASEELARAIVDPFLAKRGVLQSALQMTSEDGRIALVHLALESADGSSDRSITKRCFESLVLAALDNTHSDHRITLTEIQNRVRGLVPAGSPGQVDALVRSAITRLTAKSGPVKHYRETDDYHMSFDESERLKDQTARYVLEEQAMERELASILRRAELDQGLTEESCKLVITNLKLVVESVLFRLGESFAIAAQSGEPFHLDAEQIQNEISERKLSFPFPDDRVGDVVGELLDQPSEETRQHLRRIADAYTLFAFLRQTPDVQKVVVDIFSQGDIWLDTSAILPLLGESLLDDSAERHYTILLRAAVDAGLKLFLTEGVLEEVERHLNRCVSYSHSSTWNGRVPFVYSAYVLSGRPRTQFDSWQETIRGPLRPLDDVQEYLEDEFTLRIRGLSEYADKASTDLRGAVQELWHDAHDRRRAQRDSQMDSTTIAKLVDHDVENTVGIIEMRRSTPSSPMGYQAWWLTLDKTALRLRDHLKNQLGIHAPPSPVLSPDFLAQLFRLGPLRTAIERKLQIRFPLVMDMSRMENIPKELITLADKVRAESDGMTERVIRRNVRDALDSARARRGPEAIGGQQALETRISGQIAKQATTQG